MKMHIGISLSGESVENRLYIGFDADSLGNKKGSFHSIEIDSIVINGHEEAERLIDMIKVEDKQ